jgi:transposase
MVPRDVSQLPQITTVSGASVSESHRTSVQKETLSSCWAQITNALIEPLQTIHEQFCQQQGKFADQVRRLAKSDEISRRLMTVPGVAVVTALTFRHTIDDP